MVADRREIAEVLAASIKEGSATLVWGESGIGKTHLLEGVVAFSELPVLWGGGLRALRWVPYIALTRALRLPIADTDTASAARFVVRAAGRDSVLVLDDFQWADPETVALLPLLVGQIAVLLAVTADEDGAGPLRRRCEAAGVGVMEVGPLRDHESRALARSVAPTLSTGGIDSIVTKCGGNPRLITLLAKDPAGGGVHRLLARRLARLDVASRTALAILGLLGRPAERRLLGGGADSLVRAGLAIGRSQLIEPRPAVAAQVAADQLDDMTRARLHSGLARRLVDAGEKARHHYAAAEFGSALASSLRAARQAGSPGEAARHFALAAKTAHEACIGHSDRADRICIDSALACSDVGEHRLARDCLSRLSGVVSADDRARVALVRTRAASEDGDARVAQDEAAAGLASTVDPMLNTLLALETARAAMAVDPQEGVRAAYAALAVASDRRARAQALAVAAVGHMALGDAEWEALASEAAAEARAAGADDVYLRSLATLCTGWLRSGEPSQVEQTASAGLRHAEQAHLGTWELHFSAIILWLIQHVDGDLSTSIARGVDLLDRPLPTSLRVTVSSQIALAHADAGDIDAASGLIDSLPLQSRDAGLAGWALAEIDRVGGRIASAHERARRLLRGPAGWPHSALAAVTAAWAQWSLNRHVEPMAVGPPIGGSELELQALAARGAGQERSAALAFEMSALAWQPVMRRSHVRCLWAIADTLAAVDPEAAGQALDAATQAAKESGMTGMGPSLAQVGRKLGRPQRLPTCSRGDATLTARELDVMRVIAEGHPTPAVAQRLGIATSTVEAHVKSAMRKLDASTRTEAAVKVVTHDS